MTEAIPNSSPGLVISQNTWNCSLYSLYRSYLLLSRRLLILLLVPDSRLKAISRLIALIVVPLTHSLILAWLSGLPTVYASCLGSFSFDSLRFDILCFVLSHTVYSNTGYSANPAHNNYNNYNNNIGSAPARRDYSTSSRPGQKPQSTNHQLPPDRQLIPNDQLPPRPEPRPKSLHLPPGPNLQYNNPQPTPKQKHRPNRSHHRKPPNINDRDTILSPSAKSGGVPNPTPSYLLRASFLPIAVAKPRPILVVIDLNGTMLFRPNRKQPFNFIERPNARHFLGYCISTFTVVIWS